MIKTTDQIRVGTLWQSNIAMEASSTSNKKPIYVIRSFDKGFPLPWLCLLEGDTDQANHWSKDWIILPITMAPKHQRNHHSLELHPH